MNIDGGQGRLRLPGTAGAYELRFVLTAPGGASVIARRPITLTAPGATLDAPAAAAPAAPVAIRYDGPRGEGDFVTIVRPDAEPGH